jgi:hypothetical protein
MIVLVDTNIVLRMVERNHSDHRAAMVAVRALLERGYTLAIVPQVVYEFWVVATRPKEVNGLGMAPRTAMTELNELLPFFRLLKTSARSTTFGSNSCRSMQSLASKLTMRESLPPCNDIESWIC